MDDLIKLGSAVRRAATRSRSMPAMLSEDVIRAMRVAADPVDFVTEQRRLDKLMGREPYEGPSFEGIDLPDDEIPAMVAAGAPRSMLERAQFEAPITAALREGESIPLLDALRKLDRSRALTDSRLDRMTPEQQASSLAFVGRQADQDPFFSSAYKQQKRGEAGQRAAIGAAIAAMPVALAAKMAKDASNAGYFDDPPVLDLSGDIADYEPSYPDIGEEPLDMPAEVAVPMPEILDMLADKTDIMVEEDPPLTFMPDTPETYSEMKPGPSSGPQMTSAQARSVQAMVSKGIGYDRAMDIVNGRASMSPGEYRTVTGGRR